MTAVEKALNVARNEIGYLEKRSNAMLDSKTGNAGDKNYTKYAARMDKLGAYNGPKNGFPWCDVFFDWCMTTAFGFEKAWQMTYQKKGGLGAGCTYSAKYYKDAKRFYNKPMPGDQIFFTNSRGEICHTGIVESVSGTKVTTIEGNTATISGVIDNGGAVCRKSYALSYSRIAGYGRPDYESVAVEEDDEMTLDNFKELMVQYRKELQDNDASGYSEEARKWAVENGIVTGGSGDSFNGMWEDFLSREQLITVLYRFTKLLGAQK